MEWKKTIHIFSIHIKLQKEKVAVYKLWKTFLFYVTISSFFNFGKVLSLTKKPTQRFNEELVTNTQSTAGKPYNNIEKQKFYVWLFEGAYHMQNYILYIFNILLFVYIKAFELVSFCKYEVIIFIITHPLHLSFLLKSFINRHELYIIVCACLLNL